MAHVDAAVTAAVGIVLRYGGFYGAPDAMTKAVRQRRYPMVGDGTGIAPSIHLDDAASATVLALEHDGPAVYYVADHDPAPMREWFPVLARALGAQRPFRIPDWPPRLIMGEDLLRMQSECHGASNAKAKKELSWTLRYPSWRDGFPGSCGEQDGTRNA